jgi:Transcription factor WhiB
VTAAETMGLALLELTSLDQRPPCAHSSDAWMSEDRDERAIAARRCAGCPVFKVCADLAAEIKPSFGVWGAKDHTPRPRRAKTS